MASNFSSFKKGFFKLMINSIRIRNNRPVSPTAAESRRKSIRGSKPSGDGGVVKRGKGAIFVNEMNGKMIRKGIGNSVSRNLEVSRMIRNRDSRMDNGVKG